MNEIDCSISTPMPFFAELPYYLWGQVNYDSEGDCKRPTDQDWSWIYLGNRDTHEEVSIHRQGDGCRISSVVLDVCVKLKAFLLHRCQGELPASLPQNWDHVRAMRRTEVVADEFRHPELVPFDSHLFWGSWKWVGWFGTEFTWVGRWIMHSVVRKDPRAVNLCIEWLRDGTVDEAQSVALRSALTRLTEEKLSADSDWVKWYDHSEGRIRFPEPDFDGWYAELKAEFDSLACPP